MLLSTWFLLGKKDITLFFLEFVFKYPFQCLNFQDVSTFFWTEQECFLFTVLFIHMASCLFVLSFGWQSSLCYVTRDCQTLCPLPLCSPFMLSCSMQSVDWAFFLSKTRGCGKTSYRWLKINMNVVFPACMSYPFFNPRCCSWEL